MRIESNNVQRVIESYKLHKVLPNKELLGAHSPEQKDEMVLSEDALMFQTLVKTAKSAPDIRQDKVDSIRQGMISGTYAVKNDKIVEGMLREVFFDQKV